MSTTKGFISPAMNEPEGLISMNSTEGLVSPAMRTTEGLISATVQGLFFSSPLVLTLAD